MATTAKTARKSTRARHGLGKGLGALIGPRAAEPGKTQVNAIPPVPSTVETSSKTPEETEIKTAPRPGESIIRLPVHAIRRSPWQPRHTFDETALAELSDSIRSHGVIQPLLCRRTGTDFELIAGERRLRAAIEAGLEHVPAIIIEAADREAAEVALIENLQREDLDAVEEAEGYRMLGEQFNLTQQEIAERVGKARATVANSMRLLELPEEVRQMVSDGRLGPGHAKVLLGLTDDTERIVMARRCVMDGMTVRVLEKRVQRRSRPTGHVRAAQPDIPINHLNDLTDRLRRHFGTGIQLTPSVTYSNGRRAKGSIAIDYYDNDDLDRLLNLLGVNLNDAE